jgi:hypothetical protein
MSTTFQPGQRVRFTPRIGGIYAAPAGALATVVDVRRGDLGTMLVVEWDDRSHGQDDGGYYVESFTALSDAEAVAR